jgi:pyrroline-5-carboxylate reductase
MNKIAIIGGGNLGTAIAEGLIKSKFIAAKDIVITRRNIQSLKKLQEQGVVVLSNNVEAITNCETIILAIKPFQIKEVLQELQPYLINTQHLISVVTGINIVDIQEVVGNDIAITRAMPNTAIAIQESITCLSSANTSAAQKDYVEALFNNLGKTAVIEEKLMNAATVLGACGTAYAMRYIRANIQGGIEIGFSAATASLIAAQTVKGAAELLLTTNTHPEQEIDKVTTPKGCTITGLNEMEHQGFSSSIIKGIAASFEKIG